jgi:fatty-acyl-CoA synthase
MAQRHPQRNFITDGERRMGYAEFLQEAQSLARSFHGLGVRRGDRVAILMGNQLEWPLVEFAVSMLGGVVVTLNTWWRQDELKHALSLTDASVLVMVDRYIKNDYVAAMQQLGDLGTEIPALRHVVCLGPARPPGALSWEELRGLGERVAPATVASCMDQVRPEDAALILFTSGSTARSKGVPLLHRGLVENMFAIGERMHLTEEDRLLLVISLFWGYGLNGFLAFMTHGASIVLQHQHDPAETLRLIEAQRCTALYATPNLVQALYAHPDRKTRNLGTLRTGEARNSVVHLLHEMGAREVSTMYGLTEGYANSTVSDGRLPLEVRRRICGHALPGTELQVVDPRTRAVLPQGEVGELRIRGYITPGYCKNPQLTAQAIDEQGWFYTGDLAMLDPTGGLELKGRLKEMIKTGGISVTPADVEYLLLQVPGVVQAIVVGVPDPQRDEAVAAMVVLEAGSSVTEADLVDHVRRSAAVYKVPRLIEIVPGSDVPLTLTGKVHKDGVQQRLGALYAAANQA